MRGSRNLLEQERKLEGQVAASLHGSPGKCQVTQVLPIVLYDVYNTIIHIDPDNDLDAAHVLILDGTCGTREAIILHSLLRGRQMHRTTLTMYTTKS